jgi:hypothetical protein
LIGAFEPPAAEVVAAEVVFADVALVVVAGALALVVVVVVCELLPHAAAAKQNAATSAVPKSLGTFGSDSLIRLCLLAFVLIQPLLLR